LTTNFNSLIALCVKWLFRNKHYRIIVYS